MISVRPYRPEDRAATAGVFYRAVHEGAAGQYSLDQRQAWAPSPDPDLSRPDPRTGQLTWVSEEQGRITGFMAMDPDGYLDMAFVLPEAMGKGHAAALYDQLLAHACAALLPRLTVHASHYSRHFLERRGWQVDEVEDYVTASGVHFERFIMSLDLTEVT